LDRVAADIAVAVMSIVVWMFKARWRRENSKKFEFWKQKRCFGQNFSKTRLFLFFNDEYIMFVVVFAIPIHF
jgi:hypothetical protein